MLAAAVVLGAASLFAYSRAAQPFWKHLTAVSPSTGGNLLLFQIDVDGDGRREVFISPSNLCGTGGCPWYVYSPTRTSREVTYLGEAGFSARGYRFSPGTHTITYCWHMSAAECALGAYRFTGKRMLHRNLGGCDSRSERCAAELHRIREWQTKHAPPVLTGELPEGEGGTVVWRSSGGALSSDVPDLDRLRVVSTRE